MGSKNDSGKIDRFGDSKNRQDSKRARSQTDKGNLQTLRDQMMSHLGGYHAANIEISISGSSTQPQSSSYDKPSIDGTSQKKISEEELKAAPDPGLGKRLYRRFIGLDPQSRAFRVSDATREIIKQGQGLLKQIHDSSSSSSLTVCDQYDNGHIRELITKALELHDLALKEKDGGSGTGNSDTRESKLEELRFIAGELEDWQEYLQKGGRSPREMHKLDKKVDKASITKETYMESLDLPPNLILEPTRERIDFVTDANRVISAARKGLTLNELQEEEVVTSFIKQIQTQGIADKYTLLYTVAEVPKTNCFGFVATNGEIGVLPAEDMEHIIQEHYGGKPIIVGERTGDKTGEFSKKIRKALPGDLCIFRDKSGKMNHADVIAFTTTEGEIYGAGKFGYGNVYGHPIFVMPHGSKDQETLPDYGPIVEIYRTNRPNSRLLSKKRENQYSIDQL